MVEKIVIQKPPKSSALSGILSFFFPGVGTLYNGQTLKGVIYIIVFAGLVTMQTSGEGQPFAGLILGGFYIYQIIDAIQSAKIINQNKMIEVNASSIVLSIKAVIVICFVKNNFSSSIEYFKI